MNFCVHQIVSDWSWDLMEQLLPFQMKCCLVFLTQNLAGIYLTLMSYSVSSCVVFSVVVLRKCKLVSGLTVFLCPFSCLAFVLIKPTS